MTDLATIAISAGVGSIATIVVDAFVRPRFVGRSLAEVLAHDTSQQLQGIVAELVNAHQSPAGMPGRRPLTLDVYPVILPRLGELPPKQIGAVSALYRVLARINELAAQANDQNAKLDSLTEDSPAFNRLEEETARTLATYRDFLSDAERRISELQPALLATAHPFWSVRPGRRLPVKTLDVETLRNRMIAQQSRVATSAREILEAARKNRKLPK